MDNTLEENLNELYKFRLELTNKLNMVNREILKLEEEKVKNCNHNFVGQREEGQYGEKFYICSLCGKHRGF